MADKTEFEDEKLQKIKSEIRSLLVSNPSKSVLLNSFLKEFQKNIGKPLPFRDFNFNTPLQFLSSLTDVVQVTDADDGARLSPVTTELSSHISELVERQKKNYHKRPPRFQNLSYYSPSYQSSRSYSYQQFYEPVMASYPRPQPVFYPNPMPMLNPYARPFTQTQPMMYPPFGYADSPSNYSYPVNNPPYPIIHPPSATYVEPKRNCVPSSQDVNKKIENRSADENNELDIDGFISGDDGPDISKAVETANNLNITKEINQLISAIKDSSCVASNTTDENVVDHASLDAHSDGPENLNQNVLLGSPSGTSKCSEKNVQLDTDIKSKIWAVLESHPNGVSTSTFLDLYKDTHSDPLDLADIGYSSLKEMIVKNEEVFSFEKNKVSDEWVIYDARLKPKRRLSQAKANKWIPNRLMDNLAALAQKHKEGIDACEILEYYEEEYSTEINLEMLGFDNIFSFLENCRSITFRRYGDKGMVFPKNWWEGEPKTECVAIKEPALPPLAEMKFLWDEYFKEYECDPTFKFKPPLIPDEKLIQVKIADLHSPALIWVQFLSDVKSLNEMMFLMNLHYDNQHENYVLPENVVLPGLAVASMFAGKWHRASVISTKDSHAELLYVDYGTTCAANKSELRKLDKMFGHDRVYAIKASLFCLIPYEGDEWSMESCEFLYSRYAEKILYAEICSKNYQEPFVELILYDTSTQSEETNINDLLASSKLARYMANPASIINERSVTRFYKFLPRWFSTSDKSSRDLNLCCKNLLLCTSAEPVPINSDEIPCCKFHCIQALCQANSEAMAVVWERAVRQEEERIINHVLSELEESLKSWGWESCLESTLCCIGDEYKVDPDEVNGLQVQPAKTESYRPPRETKEYYQPPSRNVVSSHNYLPVKSNVSLPWRSTSNRNAMKNLNDLGRTRPKVIPRVIQYVEAKFNEKHLTLIVYNGQLMVCLSQLFQLTKLPSMLAKTRLDLAKLDIDFMHISRAQSLELYSDLQSLELVNPGGDPVLVLLSDAPRIVRAIDPLGSYQAAFESLAKEVEPFLDKLEANKCPTSADFKL